MNPPRHALATRLVSLLLCIASYARSDRGFEPIRDLKQASEADPRLFDCDNELLLLRKGIGELQVIRSHDGGISWGPRIPVLSTEQALKEPAVASWGTVLVPFDGPGSGQLWRSTDCGRNWSGGNQPDGGISRPIPGQEGHWLGIRSSRGGGVRNHVVFRSTDDGVNWGPPYALHEEVDTYDAAGIDLANDGAGTWIALFGVQSAITEEHGLDADLYARRSTDDGVTWGLPYLVNRDGLGWNEGGWELVVTLRHVSGARWIAAWLGFWDHRSYSSGEPGHLFFSESEDDGLTWSHGRRLAEENEDPFDDYFADIRIEEGIPGEFVLSGMSFLFDYRLFGDVETGTNAVSQSWSTTVAKALYSPDGGSTWSEPFLLRHRDAAVEGSDLFVLGTAAASAPRAARTSDAWNFVWRTRNAGRVVATRTEDISRVDDSFEARFANDTSGEEYLWYPDWIMNAAGSPERPDDRAMPTSSGLCLDSPMTGENSIAWNSPQRFLSMVDRSVYRVRWEVRTEQENPDAIPLWDVHYDSSGSGYGPLYGGQFLFLDQAGGASGVGRPQGRSEFEAWIAPLPFLTPQWRGEIDVIDGAFTTENDRRNDPRFAFRAMDFDSGGYGAQYDSGTVCLERMRVDRHDYSSLEIQALLEAPIAPGTHAPQTYPQVLEPGHAWIENGEARYVLPPEPTPPPPSWPWMPTPTPYAGIHSRKTLLPFDPLQPDWNSRLFPVAWESETLYMGELDIRAIGTDSAPDVIAIHFDVPTSEQIVSHVGLRDEPTSPLPLEVAGGPQTYVGFFYSHNATVIDPSVMPNARRIRMLGDFMTSFDIGPPLAPPADFAVSRMAISRVVPPTR